MHTCHVEARRIVMTIYPVPTAVTEARVQLAVDQEAKAPPATVNNDVAEVAEVQAAAEREQLLDLKV
jgi:hypothetical protein